MADLFEDYRLGPGWDEMFSEPGIPRETYEALHATLQALSSAELGGRAEVLARAFLDQGITFALKGVERPFPLDIVPRIISAEQWRVVEVGVAQRVRALEAFLADIYGPAQVLADRVVPRRVVVTSAHFHREAAGVVPPNGVRVHVAGVDLIRDEVGDFRVLEDNVRVPSGVSYVMENRRAMANVLPEVFAATRIQPVDSYPGQLLRALRAAAPAGTADPTVVVLTPGVHNSAYFEHALLAREMGVELVEGRDLVCVDNEVAMRTTAGEQRVDVIYRRIDDEFLDPVHFRADSVLGVAGLLNAARAGRVTIANAVGNGVADDKLLYTYVPDLIRYYLGEEPVLPNVETYRLEDPDVLDHVLGRLDQLVLKPVDGSGGAGIVIGSQATDEELAGLRGQVRRDPRGWIAQREVALSMVPTLVGNRLRARHVDLRPFAVNDGQQVRVLPGGLTRVALPEGALVVNSSQGGGSKDTWVLAPAPRGAVEPDVAALPAAPRDGTSARPAPRGGPSARPLAPGGPPAPDGVTGGLPPTRRPDPGPDAGPVAAQQQQQQQASRLDGGTPC
ncbi:circularly permuted type 2 ATP-grasp protein [Micromonospora sp. CA-263727]|uniref:circularly permuted type 2 ATP-grasp protein n=1 Tax=Micromonospora sp. CA-263727 TaxID=3239967 RepID=UPI003D8EBB84